MHHSAGLSVQMLDAVSLNETLGVFVARYSGRVDLDQIRQAYADMSGNPGFRPGLRAICDLRRAEIDLSGDDIRVLSALVRSVAPKWGGTKWLAVVASDVAYGLLRMFMSLTDNSSIETLVVRDIDEAGDWLELGVDAKAAIDAAGEAPVGGPTAQTAR